MMCTACNTNVSLNAKHCSRCDRCVEKFDHHCKWLNNCIGQCNYRHFWVLIITLAACVSIQCGFTVSALVAVANGRETHFSRSTVLGLLSLHLALTVAVLLAVGQLIAFHVWLLFKGLTTYEFIKMRRERRNFRKQQACVQPALSKPEAIEKVTQETQADVTHKVDESVLMTAMQDATVLSG